MRGVISAGHELTARAGTRMLEMGGTAFDAAVAAAFASFVCEPALTSLGGGGFFMAHSKGGPTLLYDFFPDAPGKGRKIDKASLHFYPVDIDFTFATQRFYIGKAAIAVPGCIAGLAKVYDEHCTLPLSTILSPALSYARDGVTISPRQAYFIKILSPILTASEEGRRIYAPEGRVLQKGERLLNRDLAETFEQMMAEGLHSFFEGFMTDKILNSLGDNVLITEEDLHDYRVEVRSPLETEYRGRKIYTNPPPSSGGCLTAFSLKLLEEFNLHGMAHNSYEYMKCLFQVMLTTDSARRERFDHRIYEKGLSEDFLSDATVKLYRKMIKMNKSLISSLPGSGNTTHISALDEEGNGASVTTSHGEGCGFMLPGTGIMMNNMLGEEDINPHGFHTMKAGTRMSSMMAPTIVIYNGLPEIVLGSGGSNRIRNAILQVILNIIDHRLDISDAVNAPRCHLEGDTFHIEHGASEVEITKLEKDGVNIKRWGHKNMYFGGVHAVAMEKSENRLTGSGDKRRGGVSLFTGGANKLAKPIP